MHFHVEALFVVCESLLGWVKNQVQKIWVLEGFHLHGGPIWCSELKMFALIETRRF